jgi:hypothetical protein
VISEDITLVTELAPDLRPVRADPAHLLFGDNYFCRLTTTTPAGRHAQVEDRPRRSRGGRYVRQVDRPRAHGHLAFPFDLRCSLSLGSGFSVLAAFAFSER